MLLQKKKTLDIFQSRDILNKIKQSHASAKKIQRFITNYMKQFEIIF